MGPKILKHKIFTIGYEGATQEALLASLQPHGISMLVDVRAVPLSRKKGFSKNVLRHFLEENEIQYRHLRTLGTPPEGRDAVRKNKLVLFREIFNAHLQTVEAQQGMEHLEILARENTICLLCFEADPGHCHRTIIADELHARTGFDIVPLFIAPPETAVE
ncbi:MAG: hypothetical protein JWM96_834 [Alphaproteobacteria bacterium]|nr:hypothetical protein [Alphaproteobacteria bacterium]